MHTTINYFDKAKISEYDNVEVLYLAYNELTELPNEVFSLPKLHTITFGNNKMSQENWVKFILQISQNSQIKHLHLACFPNFPADITPIKHLVSLKLSQDNIYSNFISSNPNTGISFEKFTPQLSQLPYLEELSIDFKCGQEDNISSAGFNAIADIKSLQKLKISIGEMQNFHFGKLKNIKKLALNTASTKFSDDINEMTNLEELHLQDVRLTHLHLTKELKNLHTIIFNFVYNKRSIKPFESISDDFLRLLPQIKHLELNDLPKSGNTRLLTDLQEIFTKIPEKSTIITDVITQNDTDKYATEDLLAILPIKKAQIDNLTWVILEKRLKENLEKNIQNNIFDLEKVKTYFLLGKSTRSVDLRKILKSLNWKETKDSKNADCIVVSRGFEGNTTNVSIDFDEKKAVSDTYLLAWAEGKTGFERFDEGMNTNLLLLLKSEEPENQVLGIDLLTNAYTSTPEINACLLGIALFTTDKNLKEKTKKFIEKNLSSDLLTEYKKHNKRGHEKETYEIIKNLPQIDALCFAETAFLAVKHKRNYDKFGFMDIIQLGGEMMPKAIESLGYYSYSIEIPLGITQIHPDFVTYFPAEYTSVVCHNPLPNVQKELFRLTTIKEITFDYFREDFLHEDIGKMTFLEKLEINMPLKNFPETLSKLTKTKQLVLNNEELTTIPQVFSSWKNLENIRLFAQNLAEIPVWITELKKLKIVQIYSTMAEINAEALFDLENMEELYLRTVPFTSKKPHKVLSKLKKISLNTISTTNTNTELHNTCFEELIAICPADLEEFTFESNFLSTISDSLVKFKNLKKLVLRGNFDSVPVCIGTFALETLTLISSNLTEIPAFLGDMPTLKNVELDHKFKNQRNKLQKMMPNVSIWV